MVDSSHLARFLQATAKKERDGASRFKFAHLSSNNRRMLLVADNGVRHFTVQPIGAFAKR